MHGNPPLGIGERIFIVLVLLLSTGAFLNLEVGRVENIEAGSVALQVMWSVIYLVVVMLIWRKSPGALRSLKRETWLLLIVGLALGSVFWSDDPLLTARRGIALICTTLFGIYFANRCPLQQQLRILAVTFSIVALFSIVFQLLGLGRAVDDAPGWIGIYTQKNSLGVIMTFGSAVLLLVRKSDPTYSKWAKVGIVFTVLLLLLSQSMAAIIMFVMLLVMFPFCKALRKSYRVLVILGLVTVPALVYFANWAFHNLDVVTDFLGKDVTLTGRVELWILSVVMAMQRPWLGYGYDAFWRGGEGPSSAIWHLLSWDPPHSHNGFLEVWLALGLIGLIIFVIGYLVYIRRAIQFLRSTSLYEAYWPLIFLVLTFLSNLTGANFISRNSIFWIMYVTVGVSSFVPRLAPTVVSAQARNRFRFNAQLRASDL